MVVCIYIACRMERVKIVLLSFTASRDIFLLIHTIQLDKLLARGFQRSLVVLLC